MIRRLLPGLLVAAAVVACAEGAPPEVVFAAGPASVVARPTQYCDLDLTDCRADPAAPVQLVVAPGTALQVAVPDAVAEAPWQVVFSYREASGARAEGRSPVFAPGAGRDGYALELPAPTDRLLTAEVQQYGPPPQADPETGEIQFPIRASWVLTAST